MTSNLVLSGGPLHDFGSTTAALVSVLDEVGIESVVLEDPDAALDQLADPERTWDILTVNALRWEMPAERHEQLRHEWAFRPAPHALGAVARHVREGGGLLACHGAPICFDADPLWAACIGATWNWQRSSHPPLGPVRISITEAGRAHPLTSGIDGFDTVDEVYGFLDEAPDLVPLLTGTHGGRTHPVLWTRTVGDGRVVTDLLGHDAGAMLEPTHAAVLRRAARWLNGDRTEP